MSTQRLLIREFDRRQMVSGNRHLYVHTRRGVVCYWRDRAAVLARAQGLRPVGGLAHITVIMHWADRVRRDPGNYYPYVAKPIVDGLVDAGILADDDSEHLIGPDLRAVRDGRWSIDVGIAEVAP